MPEWAAESLNFCEVWGTASEQIEKAVTAWATFQAAQPASLEAPFVLRERHPEVGEKRPHQARSNPYIEAVRRLFESRAARIDAMETQLGAELDDLEELLDDRILLTEPPKEDEEGALRRLQRALANTRRVLRRESNAWADLLDRSKSLRDAAASLTVLPFLARDPFSSPQRQTQLTDAEEVAAAATINELMSKAHTAEDDIVRGLYDFATDLMDRVRDMLLPAPPPPPESSDESE